MKRVNMNCVVDMKNVRAQKESPGGEPGLFCNGLVRLKTVAAHRIGTRYFLTTGRE